MFNVSKFISKSSDMTSNGYMLLFRKYVFPASLKSVTNRHLTPDRTFFPSLRTFSCFLFFAFGVFFFCRCGACLVPFPSFPFVFTLFSPVSSFCVSCQYRAADWERGNNSVQLAAGTLRTGFILFIHWWYTATAVLPCARCLMLINKVASGRKRTLLFLIPLI